MSADGHGAIQLVVNPGKQGTDDKRVHKSPESANDTAAVADAIAEVNLIEQLEVVAAVVLHDDQERQQEDYASPQKSCRDSESLYVQHSFNLLNAYSLIVTLMPHPRATEKLMERRGERALDRKGSLTRPFILSSSLAISA
jgi:hypothetical protein